jgi:RNA polymerase sigma-70 factor (ECF subfamily)
MPAPFAARAARPRSVRFELKDPSHTTAEDRELLASLRARDTGAVTALYRRTRSVIEETVNRLLGRRDGDAEDIAQLAFIELLKSLDKREGVKILNAWVRVVSSRVVFRHIKRRQSERNLLRVAPLESVSGEGWATPRDFLLRDAVRRVRRHLRRLDANRTSAFLLHDVYGFEMREIALMTGVSLAAARTRLTRGRNEARKRIFSDPELASLAGVLRFGNHAARRVHELEGPSEHRHDHCRKSLQSASSKEINRSGA